jgi:DNA repair exonuclease SbcCD nuclease subunit
MSRGIRKPKIKISNAVELSDVRAIFVSDLHLSATAPLARAAEPDWFAAQQRPLDEIRRLVEINDDAPVLYAGDIFDRWNASAETINFALEHLPHGYAVPGQHDLPNHNYNEIERSAYWTLVAAGHIHNVHPDAPVQVKTNRGEVLEIHGFPWGVEPVPILSSDYEKICIALCHKYIWIPGCEYEGASDAGLVSGLQLGGWDAVAFGDNHCGFDASTHHGVPIINCGGMMRRRINEMEYRPSCGLLHEDGTISRHYFDTTQDVFAKYTENETIVERILDASQFVAGLRDLDSGEALDFLLAVRRWLEENKAAPLVADYVRRACDGTTKQ